MFSGLFAGQASLFHQASHFVTPDTFTLLFQLARQRSATGSLSAGLIQGNDLGFQTFPLCVLTVFLHC